MSLGPLMIDLQGQNLSREEQELLQHPPQFIRFVNHLY